MINKHMTSNSVDIAPAGSSSVELPVEGDASTKQDRERSLDNSQVTITFYAKPLGCTLYRGERDKNAWIADVNDNNPHISQGLAIGLYVHTINHEIVDNRGYYEILTQVRELRAPLTLGFNRFPPLDEEDEAVQNLRGMAFTLTEIQCAWRVINEESDVMTTQHANFETLMVETLSGFRKADEEAMMASFDPVVSATVAVHVDSNAQQNKQHQPHGHYEPFLSDNADEGEDNPLSCCAAFVRFCLWFFVCGGLVMTVWWLACGTLFLVWCKSGYKLAWHMVTAFCGNSQRLRLKVKPVCPDEEQGEGKESCARRWEVVCRVLWMLLFGWPSCVLHLLWCVASAPFALFGFRFSVLHWRMMKVCLVDPRVAEISSRM